MRRGRRWLGPALAVLALVLLGNRGFRRLLANALELRRLRQEYAALQGEQAELEVRIRAFQRGGPALEGAVRRELGYRRPDELEYRFPPPSRK